MRQTSRKHQGDLGPVYSTGTVVEACFLDSAFDVTLLVHFPWALRGN